MQKQQALLDSHTTEEMEQAARASKAIEQYDMAISEDEIEEANKETGLNLDPDKLHTTLMEVYYHPSKYADIIKAACDKANTVT